MSHYFHIWCGVCDCTHDEGANHGKDALIAAAKNCWPLILADGAGWNVWEASFEAEGAYLGHDVSRSVVRFLLQHYLCGGMYVLGEYSTDERIPVRPLDVEQYRADVCKKWCERLQPVLDLIREET